MTTAADRSRAEVAYLVWADDRVLGAAQTLDATQWLRVRPQFEHMLGTQLWWMERWTGSAYTDPALPALADARTAYDASHVALTAFVAEMDEAGWARAEQWWKQWGYDYSLPVGELITQVAHHGTQHRSEIAMAFTEMGASPGDLDYLDFLAIRAGVKLE